jgi:cytochrome P450
LGRTGFVAAGNECDFVQEVAVNYPLYVIMSLLGLPESDFSRMLALTQELASGAARIPRLLQRAHRKPRPTKALGRQP